MQTVANDRADKIKQLMLIYLDLTPEGQERFKRMVDMLVREAQTNTTSEDMKVKNLIAYCRQLSPRNQKRIMALVDQIMSAKSPRDLKHIVRKCRIRKSKEG